MLREQKSDTMAVSFWGGHRNFLQASPSDIFAEDQANLQ